VTDRPQTRYARSGDVHIAYQVSGEGEHDLVYIAGFLSHVELFWENPAFTRLLERLGRFCRVIVFDKRGMGLSDPVTEVPTLEQRVDDVLAVMDAAGSERAVLFGASEGAPLALLMAATHPERVTKLVTMGAMARSTEADDFPWAAPADALRDASLEFMVPFWGTGASIDIFSPSLADDPGAREWQGRLERGAASPGMIAGLFLMFLEIDVRDVVPSVRVPVLLFHRRGDRAVNVRQSRWLAEHLPDARLVELDGIDHVVVVGEIDAVIAELEEFVTGAPADVEPDRVLATVLFSDLVDSTARAAEAGDQRWRELLDAHDGAVREQLDRHRGRLVKTTGDGAFATFDGPGRAIRCAGAIREALRPLGLDVRTGIHTGEVELRGDDVGGIAVHIGARVCELAGAGEVLVSRTVVDLVVGSGIGFEARGAHELRGVPGDWELYAVTG
jgi:pimeloyl-ACP methyl ester carboxylesterase